MLTDMLDFGILDYGLILWYTLLWCEVKITNRILNIADGCVIGIARGWS